MKFITTAPDRRTLVKAIAAHTGMEPSYIGPPTFNYTVGTITVDREGYVDVPDEQAAPALPPRARRPPRLPRFRPGANRPRRARRAPVWPQGGIESLGCTGRRPRPPLVRIFAKFRGGGITPKIKISRPFSDGCLHRKWSRASSRLSP